MLRMNLFSVLAVAIFVTGILACGQSPTGAGSEKRSANDSTKQFVVGPSAVLMPQGMFLLVRKGSELGAIRFTSIERSAEGTGKASYESYFQGDGSGSFRAPNVRKQAGEIDVKPLKGFHPFAFQTGKTRIRIGQFADGDVWDVTKQPQATNP